MKLRTSIAFDIIRFIGNSRSLTCFSVLDSLDSKSSSFGSVGSIPTLSTNLALCEVFLWLHYKETPISTPAPTPATPIRIFSKTVFLRWLLMFFSTFSRLLVAF